MGRVGRLVCWLWSLCALYLPFIEYRALDFLFSIKRQTEGRNQQGLMDAPYFIYGCRGGWARIREPFVSLLGVGLILFAMVYQESLTE